MNIVVHKAENILSADGMSGSDGYVQINLEEIDIVNDYNRTRAIDDSLNPVWNETFTVFIENLEAGVLYFHLFDYDRYDKDDFLGEVKVGRAPAPTCSRLDCAPNTF